jgi:hypothetical protein
MLDYFFGRKRPYTRSDDTPPDCEPAVLLHAHHYGRKCCRVRFLLDIWYTLQQIEAMVAWAQFQAIRAHRKRRGKKQDVHRKQTRG